METGTARSGDLTEHMFHHSITLLYKNLVVDIQLQNKL